MKRGKVPSFVIKGPVFAIDARRKLLITIVYCPDGLDIDSKLFDLLTLFEFSSLAFLNLANVFVHGLGHECVVLVGRYFRL